MPRTTPTAGSAAPTRLSRRDNLIPPDHRPYRDSSTSSEAFSSPIHLSRLSSRQPSASRTPSPLAQHTTNSNGHVWKQEPEQTLTDKNQSPKEDIEDDWNAWDEETPLKGDEEGYHLDNLDKMPSDLRPPYSRPKEDGKSPLNAPLLGDGSPVLQSGFQDGPSLPNSRPSLATRKSSTFKERNPEQMAKNATKKRYTWLTHGSWSLLWPTQLLILRLQSLSTPWQTFWRRHVALLRQTAQMVEHQTLHLTPPQTRKSPLRYMIKWTTIVTCSLTIAGGSWYVAVDMTTASDLTAIYNCSAFFAYAFSIPLLHERLRWSKVIAVGIAIAGVLVVAYGDSGDSASPNSNPPKHGSKSGGGAGGPSAPPPHEASSRALGNIVIGIGSVLYGFYEVLYKKVACPPDGTSPSRGMIFANTFGSCIGIFTFCILWIPLPFLHFSGIETFELPDAHTGFILLISVLMNATFSGSFLVLISLTSPVLSSVAALLTIFIVALIDVLLPPPLYSPLSGWALAGGLLIICAFFLLSWATYKEMDEERRKKVAEEIISESDVDEV
ncbi:MAG: hypothetical protein M1820_003394 [Bogoriella megaspora]|nr:MAG: hypothetical protein M1820_003394 [Bogoriella megaspora]